MLLVEKSEVGGPDECVLTLKNILPVPFEISPIGKMDIAERQCNGLPSQS